LSSETFFYFSKLYLDADFVTFSSNNMILQYKAVTVVMQEKEIKSGLKGRYMSVINFVRNMLVLTDAVS